MSALGGRAMMRLLTNAKSKTTYFWLAAGTFPARLYFVMTTALLCRGYTAPPELWVQESLENLSPDFWDGAKKTATEEKVQAHIRRLERELQKLKT